MHVWSREKASRCHDEQVDLQCAPARVGLAGSVGEGGQGGTISRSCTAAADRRASCCSDRSCITAGIVTLFKTGQRRSRSKHLTPNMSS